MSESPPSALPGPPAPGRPGCPGRLGWLWRRRRRVAGRPHRTVVGAGSAGLPAASCLWRACGGSRRAPGCRGGSGRPRRCGGRGSAVGCRRGRAGGGSGRRRRRRGGRCRSRRRTGCGRRTGPRRRRRPGSGRHRPGRCREVHEAGPGRGDRLPQPASELLQLVVEGLHLSHQLDRELPTDPPGRSRGRTDASIVLACMAVRCREAHGASKRSRFACTSRTTTGVPRGSWAVQKGWNSSNGGSNGSGSLRARQRGTASAVGSRLIVQSVPPANAVGSGFQPRFRS
jgi:hypothetical protein